jgi:hypothetical protein
VLALGSNKTRAVKEIKKVMASGDCLYHETLTWWDKWHQSGTRLVTSDNRLNYLWRTSLTLLKKLPAKKQSSRSNRFQALSGERLGKG